MGAFEKNYRDLATNDSHKYALIMEEQTEQIYSYENNIFPLYLKERFLSVPVGIGLVKNHFLFHLLEEVVQGLTTGGITQHLWKFYREVDLSLPKVQPHGPSVLSLDDLSFGFLIWLVACGVAFGAFFMEIFYFWMVKFYYFMKEKIKQLIGIILLLTLLINVRRRG